MPDPLKKPLDDAFVKVIVGVNATAQWYADKKSKQSNWSQSIRFLSIILIGLGGIFPLIGKIESEKTIIVDFTNWGYVTIAAAGTLLFLDRFFGFSSAWIRYVTTELEIRKQIREFEISWQIEMAKIDLCLIELTCDKMVQLLTMLKDFSTVIDELVKQETTNWATEFQNNISELQKMASAKLSELKPGSVKIVMKNAAKYKKITIKVDNIERKIIVGAEALIDNISPGSHTILAEGEPILAGVNNLITSVITVEGGKLNTVEMSMP